jgi:aspartyl-tRNA(Asn)/glutamyl-tRNA(Gln) amidotransferase subunit A
MSKIDLASLTIEKAHAAMSKGDFSAIDLAKAYLDVISKKNKEINAYLEVYNDVLDQAKKADEKFKKGTATKLTGIPFAIKDNILIKGRHASAASKILENYTATYDATVIEKLKKEGAVFIGRANMDEFAMGGSTENSAFGVTKNPSTHIEWQEDLRGDQLRLSQWTEHLRHLDQIREARSVSRHLFADLSD